MHILENTKIIWHLHNLHITLAHQFNNEELQIQEIFQQKEDNTSYIPIKKIK